jgi:hypothetical protein
MSALCRRRTLLRATSTIRYVLIRRLLVTKIRRVNYTTMEDTPEGKQVLTDMFALNRYPVVILFDSRNLMISSAKHAPRNVSWSLNICIHPI